MRILKNEPLTLIAFRKVFDYQYGDWWAARFDGEWCDDPVNNVGRP